MPDHEPPDRDPTGRKLAPLPVSERAFREMLETIKLVAVMLDTHGRIRFINDALLRLTGWDRDEVEGRNWFDTFLPREIAPHLEALFRQMMEHSERFPTHYENEIIGRDGGRHLIYWNNTTLRDPDGRVIGTASIGDDVTERRRAEQAVRESEATLRQVMDLVPHFIFAKDQDGRFLLANRAVAEAYGTTVDHLLHKTDADFARSADEARSFREDDLDVIREGRPKFVPLERITDARGQIRLLQTTKIPFRVPGTDAPAVLGVSIDVTELKRAELEQRKLEARVLQAQKLESLGLLAGGIAHDFNNLLVAMMGNAGLALLDLPPDSPARDRLAQIESAARRAADLTRQLLAYAGRTQFTLSLVDLNTIVTEMVEMLRAAIPEAIAIRMQLERELPAVEADATQIRQVVMNLLTNASEAIGGAAGTITVRTGLVNARRAYFRRSFPGEGLPAGLYVYLDVADTGCGMDEETVQRIFDPFFTTKFAGRGLGLAAVLGAVRGHDGAVKVHSAPGRGSIFRVLLPAASGRAPSEAASPAHTAAAWRGHGMALVVDDEPSVRELARHMLERLGFDVATAASGREAVEVCRQHRHAIRVVLLDLTMPEMDGEQTFRALRELGGSAPVILSSGFAEQEAARRFAGLGLAGFLQKPYRLAELAAALRRALDED